MSVMLSEHLPLLASAPNGIQKLRGLILELAVRGKLVAQDPDDEPASELLKRIAKERARLEAAGQCKKSKALPPVSEDEKPFALPRTWAWTRLGEITNFGQTDKDGEISDTTWVLDLEDIQKDTSVLLQKVRFSERHAKSDKNRFLEGDVLYGKLRPYLNKVIVADEEGVCTTEILPVRGYLGIFPRYLMYAVKRPDFLAYVNAKSYGMKMPRLGTDDGRLALFPLAPEKEQHRIVAKVDELMVLCDLLEAEQADAASAHDRLVETLLGALIQSTDAADLAANWQRLAEHFDTLFTTEASIDALKQAVLQLAVMGKLVPQNPNDEPAIELLKRIAQERRRLEAEGICKKAKPHQPVAEDEQPFPLPPSWAWVYLSTATTKITDGTHHSPPNLPSGDFKYISAKNIKPWGLDLSGMTYVTTEIHNEIFARCNPGFGDVLYIKDGATTGVAAINMLTEPFSMLSSVALLKPSIGLFNRYLYFVMSSPVFYDEMRAGMTGVAITRVTLAKLQAALLPLPPLAEQHRIVTKVDELLALCDRLRADLRTACQRQATLADTLIESALEAA